VEVAVVHNLPPGGARRRLACQLDNLDAGITEICLSTASPITPDACVIPLRRLAPRLNRWVRPPARYVDLVAVQNAWRRGAEAIRASRADVVYLNPCQYLKAPPVIEAGSPPALYFCDEPRPVDDDPDTLSSRNAVTRPLYAGMYARERRLDYATTRAAAQVATNSAYTATAIQERYGRTAVVVPMGVADELRDQSPDARRQDFLLSVGALTAAKSHELVIRVAAALQKPRPVTIVAPRPAPSETSRLLALARDCGVRATVKVAITDGELADLYASAHATLYLARGEPLGLVALEAQAVGCPVIVAAEGGLPETIEDGVTGWAVPRDIACAAAAVARLDDEDLHRRVSAAARERGGRYTWAASAARIADLLRGVTWPRAAVGGSSS